MYKRYINAIIIIIIIIIRRMHKMSEIPQFIIIKIVKGYYVA